MTSFFSRHASILALVAGMGLVLYLLADDPLLTWARVVEAGWAVLWVSLYRALPLFFDTVAWRLLFEAAARPAVDRMLVARWIGESVNALLPMAQIGGDVVRARVIAADTPGGMTASGAATMADFTLGLVAQAIFTVIGAVVLFIAVAPSDQVVSPAGVALAVVVFATLVGGFLLWQLRIGPGRFSGLVLGAAGRLGLKFDDMGFHDFDRGLRDTYARRRAVVGCVVWRLLGWFVRIGKTGIILWLLDVPVELTHLIAIESLSYAIRSAAFFVPGAIGVQEAGILGLGLALGLTPDVALALAVIKRAREVAVGVPALALWAWPAGRRSGETRCSQN